MSENKRKRTEDHYGSRTKFTNQLQGQNPTAVSLQQPRVVNSVLASGEQFIDAEQILQANNQNAQSNLIYILLPPGVNQTSNVLQGVPTLLLMPKGEQANPSDSPPQLHYYMPSNDKVNGESTNENQDEDVAFLKDVKPKAEEEREVCAQYIPISESDPLQIQVNAVQQDNNVSFALVPQYEEIQPTPILLHSENLQKPAETADLMKWKTQFKCDYPGCTVTLPSFYEKKLHVETHIFPANTEFKCSICNMLFERASDRNKHVESHSVVNTHKCKNCTKSFPYYTSLVKHINEEKCAASKPCVCHFCGVQFVDADDLEKHHKLNMKLCACRAKICSEQAFELHTSLCTVYKQKVDRTKRVNRKKKLQRNHGVIVVE